MSKDIFIVAKQMAGKQNPIVSALLYDFCPAAAHWRPIIADKLARECNVKQGLLAQPPSGRARMRSTKPDRHVQHTTMAQPAATNPSSAFFYILTAAHAAHVVGGGAALFYVDVQALRLRLGPGKRTAIDVSALFWHYLNVLWLYLMMLFYIWG